tara:strand:+ start:157 stop:1461 length:1305 start_codon:yes stop_codon:yes gene_type:complete
MKQIFLLILFTILFSNSSVQAKSFNLDRTTGECTAPKKNRFSNMDYDVYKNTFIKLKLDFKFESGATYREEGLLKNIYWIETRFREASMSCLLGDKKICEKIVQHAKYLAENKAIMKNYGGPDNNDWYEATFINNHILSHVLFAYWVAKEKIPIEKKTNKLIKKWAIKSVKKNDVSRRPQGLNNHSLNSARSFILAGGIFEDEKLLSKGEKIFNKYLDKEFKVLNDKHIVLPVEAARGSRAIFYTGRTLNIIMFLANLLKDSERDPFNEKFNDKIHKAVEFMLDSDLDNSLIYPWAKKNKSAIGDYKKQIIDNPTYSWVPAYLYAYKDSKLTEKIFANKNVKKFIKNEKNKNFTARWALIDNKCVYPGKWIDNKKAKKKFEYIAIVKNKLDEKVLIKVRTDSKEQAVEEAMKKCTDKHENGCYVHYSSQVAFGG